MKHTLTIQKICRRWSEIENKKKDDEVNRLDHRVISPLSIIWKLPRVWNGSYRSDQTLKEENMRITNIMREEQTQMSEQTGSWRWENKHLALSEKPRGETEGEPQSGTGSGGETAESSLDGATERSLYIFPSTFQWNIRVKTRLQWAERANTMWGT